MRKCRFNIIIVVFVLVLTTWTISADTENFSNNLGSGIQTIRVSNESEFIQAIGSNRIIELAPGTYYLSECYEQKNDKITWQKEYDGYQLTIQNVQNLTIVGRGDERVKIYNVSTAAYVFRFKTFTGKPIILKRKIRSIIRFVKHITMRKWKQQRKKYIKP